MSALCDSPVPDLARELAADVSTEPCRKAKGHELPHKNEAGVMWTDDYVGHLRTRGQAPPHGHRHGSQGGRGVPHETRAPPAMTDP
jgi:hypothetical protein